MRPLHRLLSALFVVCGCGKASGELSPAGQPVHVNDGNFSERDHMRQEPIEQRAGPELLSGANFNLKVQVNDVLSRQQLSQAFVEIYVNYTRTHTVVTGEDGGVSLYVLHQAGASVTIVASKDGYISAQLPFKTNRLPIFSSVTLPLLRRNQGNIWLFEDSVLITGKPSDASSRSAVQFPKSLLNLTDDSNVTSVKGYLTVPKLESDDGFLKTRGIVASKSGYHSVDLTPVAAVSVQLFSGDTELPVNGPVQINLGLPDTFRHQMSSVVPAWYFNRTTGGWMRKGLGTVESVEGKLTWTFTAPHLGYWMAAPLSSTGGFFRLDVPLDFILHHWFILLLLLGGLLFLIVCLLLGTLCCGRKSLSEGKTRLQPVTKKDQTTSTCDDEVLDVSSLGSSHGPDKMNQLFKGRGDNPPVVATHNGNVIANPSAVSIAMECSDLELNSTGLNDLTFVQKMAEHIRVPNSLMENLFFYNQPVAILHTPAFFQLEDQPEEPQRSRSATLPRSGAMSSGVPELLSKDSYTQTGPNAPSNTRSQAEGTELELSEDAASNNTRANFNLQESVSVPGTLNKIVGSRHSVHALAELSEIPSLQPPRAWFVSLEGKPAAEIHYAVSEQQRRRRPTESRETSLDSGVDMSELSQTSGRRAVTLERNSTFVKSTSSSKHAPSQ